VDTRQPRRRRAQPRARIQLTERDRTLLAFAAENRFVIAVQAAALLGISETAADARMRALGRAGYLLRERALHGEPPWDRITRAGVRAIGSDLPTPRAVDLSTYRHDLGLGWLMVAARRGRFGPVAAVISERRMRSDDGRATGGEYRADGRPRRHGVRLGGTGPGGRERLHYPDLMLITATGHRIAFELELTTKAAERRERILAGYAADPSIDRVIYLVDRPQVQRAIERSVARVGISDLVGVQRVAVGTPPRQAGDGPAVQRRHGRARTEGERVDGASR
jgi:hypothetical protein